MGYERRNMFVPVKTILDFNTFNQSLFDACEYEIFILEPRKTDNYAKVTFDNNLYSASPKYAKEEVYIKASSDKVWILNKSYEVIMEHPRLYGKGKESMNWLPYIDLMSKRPAAIKYTGFYQQLPDNWQKYLGNQNAEGKRKGLTSLDTMLQKHDMRTAEEALAFAISNGVKDADSVLAAYRTLTSGVQQMQPMQLERNIIQMPSYAVDNNKYDTLFGKEISAL